MGGTPRGKDKPRPSYEDGELRDPSIRDLQEAGFKEDDLAAVIKKAAQVAGKPSKG